DVLFRFGAVGGLSDDQLLELFLRRQDDAEAAFTALVGRHGPMVLRVARGVLSDPAAADDAFQTTFLVLVRRAHTVLKGGSVASWPVGVALRVARRARRDATRRLARERVAAERAGRRGSKPGELAHGDCPELFEEIDRLPESYRRPVVLCYLEGLSTDEA